MGLGPDCGGGLADLLRALPAGSLHYLDLSYTPAFGDSMVESLQGQRNLRTLKLRGCQMNDAGIERLLATTSDLRELDVSIWPYRRMRAFGRVGDGTLRACAQLRHLNVLKVCGRRGTSPTGMQCVLQRLPRIKIDVRHNLSLNVPALLATARELYPACKIVSDDDVVS